MSDPVKMLAFGTKYPYDASSEDEDGTFPLPDDWAYRAARGVISDLTDRRGIKHGFEQVDWDVRAEIVSSLAGIIREAHRQIEMGWVSVSSKLPEQIGVWVNNGGQVYRGYYDHQRKRWMDYDDFELTAVTDWMPIRDNPNPPGPEVSHE